MADKAADEFPVWRTPEGEPVSCVDVVPGARFCCTPLQKL
jgi:hypothetical protein